MEETSTSMVEPCLAKGGRSACHQTVSDQLIGSYAVDLRDVFDSGSSHWLDQAELQYDGEDDSGP